MAKAQQTIPGTESEHAIIEELALRKRALTIARLDLQKQEKLAEAELMAEIDRAIEDGELSLDPEAEGVRPVHRFADDDGVDLVVKYGAKRKVSVVKDKGEDDDDE